MTSNECGACSIIAELNNMASNTRKNSNIIMKENENVCPMTNEEREEMHKHLREVQRKVDEQKRQEKEKKK